MFKPLAALLTLLLAAASPAAAVTQRPHGAYDDHAPAWSPDERRLAFVRECCSDGNTSRYALRVVDVDGGRSWQIASLGVGIPDVPPRIEWISTGELVTHTAVSSSGTSAIVVVFDGETSVLARDAERMRVSPDRTLVAYRTPRYDLNVVGTRGDEPRTVTNDVGAFEWSPDGAMLVVGRDAAVQIVSARDGSVIRELYRPVQQFAFDPAWSPDGTRIAFVSLGNIVVAPATGGEAVPVASGALAENLGSPTWSRDGSRLYFVDGHTGRVWFVPASGGLPTRTALRDVESFSPSGTRIAYADAAAPGCRNGIAVASEDGRSMRLLTNDCRVFGTTGRDSIRGTRGPDVIAAYAGADLIDGRGGGDRIRAGRGDDVIRIRARGCRDRDFASPCDRVHAGPGADRVLVTGGLESYVAGGRGRDVIDGGAGADLVVATDGWRDRVACGRGRDRVVADPLDVVGRDCERVELRPRRRSSSP